MQFLNQYSFVLISILIHLGSIVAAAMWFPGTIGLLLVLLVLLGLAALGWVFQFRDADDFGSAVPESLIGKGLPVLLAIYSNF